MKISKQIFIGFLLSTMFGYASVFAAGIDHFNVELNPNSAKTGEALDLTIEAVDKNNETVLDYTGTVLIFSESDPEAELPNTVDENTYKFVTADQGKVKFENGVKFKKEGTQEINVYDLNDDTVFGIAEAAITKDSINTNEEILILSPDKGLTIGENTINISGTSKKNHNIKIIINGKDELTTTTNNEGIFEQKVEDLIDGENVFKAQVLDADGNVLGESEETKIKVDLSSLSIKSVKVTPGEVESENSYEVEVITNPKLREVSVIINDILTSLEETKNGVYSAKLVAPKEVKVYKIDVRLKDELGHEKTELGAGNLTVKEIKLTSATGENNTENETTEEGLDELKITGLKLVELKTKSILTWDKLEKAKSYNVYKKILDGKLELIENVSEPKFEVAIIGDKIKYDYFAVKAVGEDKDGEIYEGSLSDATKIKTGPELLILLLISMFLGLGFIIFRKKRI